MPHIPADGKGSAGINAKSGLSSYGTKLKGSTFPVTAPEAATFHKGTGLPATTARSFGKNPKAGRYAGTGNGGPNRGALRGRR